MTARSGQGVRVPSRATLPGLLLAGFALAVGVRVVLGGEDVAHSASAGWVFAAILGALAAAYGPAAGASLRSVAVGLAGAAVLCAPVVLLRFLGDIPTARPAGSFVAWTLPVAAVAIAEEAYLRGALHEAVTWWKGPVLATILGATCFALLHVPLYGWSVVPLDLAVGLWLGALREVTGGWVAPAVAHTGADFAGWWLR